MEAEKIVKTDPGEDQKEITSDLDEITKEFTGTERSATTFPNSDAI